MANNVRCKAAANDYIQKLFEEEEYSTPSRNAQLGIAMALDKSASRIFDSFKETIANCPEMEKGVQALRKAPLNCGGFKNPKKAILKDYTSFEQMLALSEWIDIYGPNLSKDGRTIALAAEDGIVPLRYKPAKKSKPTLMTALLGNSVGALKAPRYEDWAENDPKYTEQELFIDPLNSLEIVRQPDIIGSLLLKSNSYDRSNTGIGHNWRFKISNEDDTPAEVASVEFPNQANLPNEKRACRAKSAGYNLTQMIGNERLSELNILPRVHYKDYHDDGYKDELRPKVTPILLLLTLPEAFKGNTEDLDREIGKLFATRLGHSKIPIVKQFAANKLF